MQSKMRPASASAHSRRRPYTAVTDSPQRASATASALPSLPGPIRPMRYRVTSDISRPLPSGEVSPRAEGDCAPRESVARQAAMVSAVPRSAGLVTSCWGKAPEGAAER